MGPMGKLGRYLAAVSVARRGSIGGGGAALTTRVAVAAAMALLVGSGAPVAQAAPGAIPPGTPRACVGLDVYRATSATRALCHVRTIPLSAITKRADGGHEYHYEVGGSPITIAFPPAGFNAVTASQSEREAYGIPREPAVTETAAHARWEQEIHHFHPSAPPTALYQPVLPAKAKNSSVLTSELTPPGSPLEGGDGGSLTKTTHGGCSACWAGYVDTGKLSGGIEAPPFQDAGIMYKEPQRLDDCEGTHASPWVGLGGYGSEPLDQAGTELGKGDGIAEHQAWIENYEEPVQEEDYAIPLPFYATPGALFQVVVAHGLHNEYSVDYWNGATQQAYGPVTRSSRKAFKGLSAEYIMERAGEAPLANFGKWEVTEAWAQYSGAGPWDFQHHAETIYAGTRRVASTSALQKSPESGFHVTWEGFSESNTCTPEDPPPIPTTESYSLVPTKSAQLKGSVDPNYGETHYYFQYGETSAYGNVTPTEPAGSGGEPVPVSSTVSGLKSGTTYHYRLVAYNAKGTTNGNDQTFTTPSLPTVTTEAATGITAVGATLHGGVNPHEVETHYYFQYGTTTSYGSATPENNAGSGKESVSESATITGLEPGATYHYRVVAYNSWAGAGETSKGSDQTFSTAPRPSVVTTSNGNIHVFVRLADGEIADDEWVASENKWHLYATAVSAGLGVGTPSALVTSNGNIQVLVRLWDGEIGDDEWIASENKWHLYATAAAAGDAVGDPSAIVTSNGNIHVYFKFNDGEIAEDELVASENKWHLYATAVSAGLGVGTPSALVTSNGNIQVLVRLWDGEIGDDEWIASENKWHLYATAAAAGDAVGDPSAIVTSNGNIHVYFKFNDGEIAEDELVASENKWHLYATAVSAGLGVGTPSALVTSNGNIQVLVRLWDGEIGDDEWIASENKWHLYATAAAAGDAVGDPSAIVTSNGNIHALFSFNDGEIAEDEHVESSNEWHLYGTAVGAGGW